MLRFFVDYGAKSETMTVLKNNFFYSRLMEDNIEFGYNPCNY